MSSIKILRFIYGYIEFVTKGGFVERFINLAAIEQLNIWNLETKDKTMHGFIGLKEYEKLEKIAIKSGVELIGIKNHGLPFLAKENHHRIGLVIGACFFAVFTLITSFFIWNIQIETSETVSTELVLASLEEVGFGVGSFRYSVDTAVLTRQLLFEYAYELSWMAINLSGSNASIEIRDYVRRRDDETYTTASDLVADFDGIILSIDVYSGEKVNIVGSAVTAGEVLISGAVQNSDFSFSYFQASGKVTALHSTSISQIYTYSATTKTLTEEKTIYSICFLGLQIPLGFNFNDDYIEYSSYNYLSFDDVKLPFAIKKAVYVSNQETQLEANYKITMAAQEFTMLCYDEHRATTLLQENIEVDTSNNKISITGNFECIDFMGESQEIELF